MKNTIGMTMVLMFINKLETSGNQANSCRHTAPITAQLTFLDADNQPSEKASIGDQLHLVVTSEQAGPHNMMVTECVATRVGGEGEAVPFTIIDNGCPRYPALVGPVEQDFDKNRLKAEMKAFRLDGSYDIQIQCTIMFCAGPNGCPPSNCLDSGTNELFMSHGRRKRSIGQLLEEEQQQTAETLSAIIRVLAEGEQEEEVERFYNRTGNRAFSYKIAGNGNATHNRTTSSQHRRRQQQQNVQRQSISPDMVCLADSLFISTVVSMSMICLMLSALIVIWGCHSLRKGHTDDGTGAKLPK
uniref:ZP domain-containing protein n=1 Tax=Globodera pallida TaxID=36090 RepID=A0A183BWQ0_GLOPA